MSVLPHQLDGLRRTVYMLRDRVDELEETQAKLLRVLHGMVDQTNPNCPIGVALTMAGLERCP